MVAESARAAFAKAARRQALSADAFAGEMREAFRGTVHEDAAKQLAKKVAGTAEDAALAARRGRRAGEFEAESKLARTRAEDFVQQHLRGL
ncbi:hypothetical protein [Amycolatopsis sp. 195334CR]|uniref:hypothetical protein n=1 Tax=Amycolatopsis sp. 195334CR TaxID=2814588 RepID=UPI001A8EFDB9|nr:hypothetical protein [Amycolatopsis sp. 195334CR]MBN6040048.1 hypothetical protein [Amycolatopsis sp. 195334CR]